MFIQIRSFFPVTVANPLKILHSFSWIIAATFQSQISPSQIDPPQSCQSDVYKTQIHTYSISASAHQKPPITKGIKLKLLGTPSKASLIFPFPRSPASSLPTSPSTPNPCLPLCSSYFLAPTSSLSSFRKSLLVF